MKTIIKLTLERDNSKNKTITLENMLLNKEIVNKLRKQY